MFRSLDRHRPAGASAKPLQIEPAVEIRSHDGLRLLGSHAAEVEAVREDDEVAREAVAAEVAALPRFIGER
jgi:hypothetical protein